MDESNLKRFYTTRVITLGNQSVIWQVTADTEAGVKAGVEALRKRAEGGAFIEHPMTPREAGGFRAAGNAEIPGHGSPQWDIETIEVGPPRFSEVA